MFSEIPDPYAAPKLKRGVYPCPANRPGWIEYQVVGSDGGLVGVFGMRDDILGTVSRREAFERRLRKFLAANDTPILSIVRAG